MHAAVWIALIAAAGWVSSWWWHPRQACKKCDGSGRSYGKIFKSNFHHCAVCGGNGKETRPGTKVMMALGVIKTHPDQTGPGWGRRRRREARRR
jgi:DnaJ-class molecular chaperone